MRLGIILALCLVFALPVASDVNFSQCLLDFQNMTHPDQLAAGRDNHGRQVTKFQDATALSYTYCKDVCGTSSEPFSWKDFSQQFSAWLLPWLALLSNLPFSAHDIIDDVRSMALTVGSPMLAAYSLAITVMNHRWLTQLLGSYHKGPNKEHIETVIEVLSRLQQCPVTFLKLKWLRTTRSLHDHGLWKEVLNRISVGHTWSISAATSVAWVVIAYVFTVVDSLTPMNELDQDVNSAGQGVGSLWLWLLTIVVGWLQVRQKTTAEHMGRTAEWLPTGQVFHFRPRNTSTQLRRDEHRIPPVFNYSRVLPWTADVLKVEAKLREEARQKRRVINQSISSLDSANTLSNAPDARLLDQTADDSTDLKVIPVLESGALPRMAVAFFLALILQWGTTGSAVIVSVFTPTIGLGCRSFSFLVYGAISTIVCLMFIMSSLLSYAAVQKSRKIREVEEVKEDDDSGSCYEDGEYDGTVKKSYQADPWYWLIRKSAIALRRTAKILAWANAAWIMTACFFQFAKFYDRCYCNSSVLGLGSNFGYSVIQYTMDDKKSMRKAWTGGVVVGLTSAFIFATFIALQLNPHIGY